MTFQIKLISCTLLLIGIINQASCQTIVNKIPISCPEEKIQIHFSHESAFSGEIVWFKVYCVSSLFPSTEISKLAFIEMVNDQNIAVVKKRILLEHGEGTGEFEIPDTLSTGLYYIIAYTNWMKNFGEGAFFKKGIIIVNPEKPFNLPVNNDVVVTVESNSKAEKSSILKIIPDKLNYALRDAVGLTIRTDSTEKEKLMGSFSISVNHKEPSLFYTRNESTNQTASGIPESIEYLPDYKGIRLSGWLYDFSGNTVSKALVTLSLPGKGTDLKSSITTSKGKFDFLLKPKEGEQDVVITLPDPDCRIEIEDGFWNRSVDPLRKFAYGFNQAAFSYLNEKFAYYQLQNRFKKQNLTNKTASSSYFDSTVFYSKPNQLIRMKDYIRLDSIGEYFYELTPFVKLVKRRREFTFMVFDPQTQLNNTEKPGVFIDGIAYDNYNEIANIPVQEINQIAIVPNTYYYGDFTFGGIIDIHTKKADFSSVRIMPSMTRFIYPLADTSKWKFSSPDYQTSSYGDRIPDFRYLFYWEPCVKVDSSGESSVQFYTGDVKGCFVVRVVGISDSGKILQTEVEINAGD
jgi:hypothetical protein